MVLAASTSETLTLAVVLLCVGGFAAIGFAFYAFRAQTKARKKVGRAVDAMREQTSTFMAGPQPQGGARNALLDSAASYVRALAELAEALGKVSPSIAALVVSTIPFALATAIVIIDLVD